MNGDQDTGEMDSLLAMRRGGTDQQDAQTNYWRNKPGFELGFSTDPRAAHLENRRAATDSVVASSTALLMNHVNASEHEALIGKIRGSPETADDILSKYKPGDYWNSPAKMAWDASFAPVQSAVEHYKTVLSHPEEQRLQQEMGKADLPSTQQRFESATARTQQGLSTTVPTESGGFGNVPVGPSPQQGALQERDIASVALGEAKRKAGAPPVAAAPSGAPPPAPGASTFPPGQQPPSTYKPGGGITGGPSYTLTHDERESPHPEMQKEVERNLGNEVERGHGDPMKGVDNVYKSMGGNSEELQQQFLMWQRQDEEHRKIVQSLLDKQNEGWLARTGRFLLYAIAIGPQAALQHLLTEDQHLQNQLLSEQREGSRMASERMKTMGGGLPAQRQDLAERRFAFQQEQAQGRATARNARDEAASIMNAVKLGRMQTQDAEKSLDLRHQELAATLHDLRTKIAPTPEEQAEIKELTATLQELDNSIAQLRMGVWKKLGAGR